MADSAVEQIARLEAENQRLNAELEKVSRYLGQLMQSRYPDINLLDDAFGRAMQIDNGFAVVLKEKEQELQQAKAALHWIATVNESLDLRKMDQKTLIGLIYELRGKAKAACTA